MQKSDPEQSKVIVKTIELDPNEDIPIGNIKHDLKNIINKYDAAEAVVNNTEINE